MDLGPLVALAEAHLATFLLVFCRLGAVLAVAPVVGHRAVPVAHRAALALLLALVVTPLLPPAAPLAGVPALAVAVGAELMLGGAIGLVAGLALAAVEGAGELIATQMGLSLTAVFDPSTGGQVSALGRFQHLFAVLLLLVVNGHHLIVRAAVESFRRARPGSLASAEVPAAVAGLGGTAIRSGLELALPVVGLLLVVNIGLALLARIAPQTNVFLLGVPLTLAVGLLALAEIVPVFAEAIAGLTARMAADLDLVLIGAARGAR